MLPYNRADNHRCHEKNEVLRNHGSLWEVEKQVYNLSPGNRVDLWKEVMGDSRSPGGEPWKEEGGCCHDKENNFWEAEEDPEGEKLDQGGYLHFQPCDVHFCQMSVS